MNEHRAIRAAEDALCEAFDREHCLFVGRATAALYLALRGLCEPGARVVVPAITCPNPASAVLYAGMTPVFCDCRLADFTLDPEHLLQLIATQEVGAILAVDLYGHPADYTSIRRVAGRIPIVEDAGQALGGSSGRQKLGSIGAASVLSFSSSKILGLQGGGALLTDDAGLAERCRRLRPELVLEPRVDEMESAYARAYSAIRDLGRAGIDSARFFRLLPEAFRPMYLTPAQPSCAQAVVTGLGRLEAERQSRREKTAVYRDRLKHPLLEHPHVSLDEAAFWRYSLRYTGDDTARLAERLRERGLHTSQWYPNIAPWYAAQPEAHALPGAATIEAQILNFRTDAEVPKRRLRKDCDAILAAVEGHSPTGRSPTGRSPTRSR